MTIGDLTFSANPHPPTRSTDPNAGNARKVAAGSTTITQSNSQTITSGNSVSCNNGVAHTDNHYLRVFDRWGNLLYEVTNHAPDASAVAWDGRSRGDFVLPGVYAWVMELELVDVADVAPPAEAKTAAKKND